MTTRYVVRSILVAIAGSFAVVMTGALGLSGLAHAGEERTQPPAGKTGEPAPDARMLADLELLRDLDLLRQLDVLRKADEASSDTSRRKLREEKGKP